ncbi:MAG TPA: hypothetical protein VN672_08805 [Solirubrobacteraceae bacterium]|nr:hypothetical protein [Solirubrobacteraceae bacterium]
MSTDPGSPEDPAVAADRQAAGAGTGAPGAEAEPSEEQLRAAYEAELARITSSDMMLQAAVSLLNIGSYRLLPRPSGGGEGAAQAGAGAGAGAAGAGQDLEQARDAIDAVRALLEILERRVPGELRPLRDALSQLQMAYAREVQAGGQAPAPGSDEAPGGGSEGSSGGAEGEGGDADGGEGESGGGRSGPGGAGEDQPSEQPQRGPGPAESSGRLWVPGR